MTSFKKTEHSSDNIKLQAFLDRAFGPIVKTQTVQGVMLEMRSAGFIVKADERIPLVAFAIPEDPANFKILSIDEATALVGEAEIKRIMNLGNPIQNENKLPTAVISLILILCWFSPLASAQKVSFDTLPSFPVKDVTPEQFRTNNPTTKVIEARFRISADIKVKETELDYIRYELVFPTNCSIHDYLPKTRIESEVAAPIEYSSENSHSSFYQISTSTGASVGYAIGSANIGANTEYKSSNIRKSDVQIRYLPPKEVVVSAGTKNCGATLWWKLRPMSQVTLEGEKEYVGLIQVPANWHGSSVRLKCAIQLKGADELTEKVMEVGIYPYGDEKSKEYIEREARTVGSSNAKAIEMVLKQEHIIRPDLSNLFAGNFDDENIDKIAGVLQKYASGMNSITNYSSCPSDFLEAFVQYYSTVLNEAEIFKTHPHLVFLNSNKKLTFQDAVRHDLFGLDGSEKAEQEWYKRLMNAIHDSKVAGNKVDAIVRSYGAKGL